MKKVRVYDFESREMWIADGYDELSELFMALNTDDSIFSEPMQSTGLKDKKGKEVFEGDIIKDSEDFIAQVVYDKEYAGFGLNYQPFDLTEGLSVTFEELKNEYQNTFKVVGNIWEDGELLDS